MSRVSDLSLENHDRELERRVAAFLSDRNVPGLRRLQVQVCAGVVTLRGQVASFYEKQLSHQCCRRVAGVRQLVDFVDVASPRRPNSRREPRGWHFSLAH